MQDFLNEFTKEEIIDWIRGNVHVFNQPKKSDLFFTRWQNRENELIKKRDESQKILESIDFKARNELAEQYNNEKDWQKKLVILTKIDKYEQKFREWTKFEAKINKEKAENEKLYKSIDEARKEEIPVIFLKGEWK